MTQIVQALTIAGSDSGGGAGIQADLKTFQMRGVYGMSVLAAVTAQNTLGVQAIHGVPLDIIRAQIDSIAADFQVAAFKIGMLGTAEVIECVAEKLAGKPFGRLVLDPVMVAKGGAPLLQQNAVAALKRHLLPLADVLTPNLPEAEALTGIDIQTDADAERAARILQEAGVQTVIGCLCPTGSSLWKARVSPRCTPTAPAAPSPPASPPSWPKAPQWKRPSAPPNSASPPPSLSPSTSATATGR